MPRPKNTLFFGYEKKMDTEQKAYVDAIFDKKIVFCSAKAGSGKTTLAVGAAKLLNKPLYYIFSPVEEQSLGFTPGTVEEKEAKYIQPLKDALLEINEDPAKVIYSAENMMNIKNGNAWVHPMSHVFARGINIKDACVIIDEAQNFTRGELKKILTRIHDSCTVIVIGHEFQCDLKNPSKSGFVPYIEHFRNESYAKVCRLSKNYRGVLADHADSLTWE